MYLITILGPTCSGKSSLAIKLAKEINKLHGANSAVVVSCDSRQVYKYLDIGTGKIEGNWQRDDVLGDFFSSEGVSHFLIDFLDPMQNYSLNNYLKDFVNLIASWQKNGFQPKYLILCGGTGLYAKAVFDEYDIQEYDPRFEHQILELKTNLNQYNANELQELLRSFASDFESKMNNSDLHNPRRLINQIIKYQAKENNWTLVDKLTYPKFENKFQFFLCPSDLKQRLEIRLNQRFTQGLVDETFELIQKHIIALPRLLELGLEYRQFYFYFLGLQSLNEFHKNIVHENWQYIRRQITWFKKQTQLVQISNTKDIFDVIRKHNLTKPKNQNLIQKIDPKRGIILEN